MKKLETLTPEQEKLMVETKDFWIDYIFSCKNSIDKEQAKINIEWLYDLAKVKSKPIIIYVDSPMGCQFAVAYLKEFLKQTKINKSTAQVWAQVGAQVWAQVGDQVRAQVRDQVRDQVGAQVWDQVRDQVMDQVWASKMEFNYFPDYGSVRDYGWVSFYDFFTKIGVINHDKYNQFKKVLLSGIYDMIQLEGFCIVSNMPNHIERASNRLHSETGPAIQFRDGYELYYWKGVGIPSKWIKEKDKITREEIIGETNAEKRRCLMEILGVEKFAHLLGIKQIDTDVDQNSNKAILYRTKEKDTILKEHIHYARVVCPSTQREYFLCVPNTITNIWDAIGWSFSKTKDTYKPVIET